MTRQLELLTRALKTLPDDGIREFIRLFQELRERAYRWDLWDAAFIIQSGCSDDGFMDFRNWLISMGRTVFENALLDPETLAGPARDPEVEVCAFEEFSAIAPAILEERGVADEGPTPAMARRREPLGERFDHATLPHRFPKLWAAFG
jgi:hypothetical protein